MIIANGTIEFKKKTGGGINMQTGYPVAATETWSDPIECQYMQDSLDLTAIDDSEHVTTRHYTILIETFQAGNATETLRLKDDAGNTIGKFSVVSFEELRAVGQTKIKI